MDKTNYPLLSIVAIVAITAIVAMFVHAQQTPTTTAGPIVALTAGGTGSTSGSSLTGNVVADSAPIAPVAQPERARPSVDWHPYDYNNDGTLDDKDVAVLESVLSRARFCPANKICDVNSDGTIDSADRLALLGAILRMQGDAQTSHGILTYSTTPDTADEDSFWTAVTGAPTQ